MSRRTSKEDMNDLFTAWGGGGEGALLWDVDIVVDLGVFLSSNAPSDVPSNALAATASEAIAPLLRLTGLS